jgi:hypothetical protein
MWRCFPHVFPLNHRIYKYKYKYREYIYIFIYACVRVWLYVYIIYYIYTHTYAHQKPYIRTYINMAIAHKTQRFQDQTFHANSSRVSPWQLQLLLTERHHQLPSVGPLENWCVWSTLRHSKAPKRVDSSKVQFQNRGNYHVSILLIPFGGYYHLKKMMIWKKILDLGQFREHDLRLNWRWFWCCWGRWCGCLPASIIHVVHGQANGASFKALSAS